MFSKSSQSLVSQDYKIVLEYECLYKPCLLYLSTSQVISTNDMPHSSQNMSFFVGLFLCVCVYRAVCVYFSSPMVDHNATFVCHMQCLFQDVWPLLP